MADEKDEKEPGEVKPAELTPVDEREIRWQAIARSLMHQRDSAMNAISQLEGEIEILKSRYANKKN